MRFVTLQVRPLIEGEVTQPVMMKTNPGMVSHIVDDPGDAGSKIVMANGDRFQAEGNGDMLQEVIENTSDDTQKHMAKQMEDMITNIQPVFVDIENRLKALESR